MQNMIILLLACTQQCVFESVGPWCPLLCLRLQESWSKSRSYCEKLDHRVFHDLFLFYFQQPLVKWSKCPPPNGKCLGTSLLAPARLRQPVWLIGGENFFWGEVKTFQLMMCKSLSQMSIQFLTCVKIYTWLKVTRVSDLPATGGGNCPITFLQPLPLI